MTTVAFLKTNRPTGDKQMITTLPLHAFQAIESELTHFKLTPLAYNADNNTISFKVTEK